MFEMINFGDVEAAVIDILENDTPEFDALIDRPNTSSSMNGYTDGDRWICITLGGGSVKWPSINRPRVDVEVYAERRSVALDLANIALGSIRRAMGSYYGFGLFISYVAVEQGVTRIPDPYVESSRFFFALRLTTVPHGDALVPPSS